MLSTNTQRVADIPSAHHLRNRLLHSLPADEMEWVAPHLVAAPLGRGQVLYREDDSIGDAYFLNGGVCSLVKTMRNGATAQVASIGHEGVIGASVYFGERRALTGAIIQVGGADAVKMSAEAFTDVMNRRGPFFVVVTRYLQALVSQVMQTAACSSLHSAEERCCRLLLMTSDRVGSDDLNVTHEFVALMLGVRRPTVTLVIGELQKAGIVETRRGAIRILDRHRLESTACECYAVTRRHYSRLVPEGTSFE